MGFFSWKTMDTDESISNCYSHKLPFTVFMLDDKGNKYREDEYEGYGIFGGKDFFELLAEMNGGEGRDQGIALRFSNKEYKSPNLFRSESCEWIDEEPEDCDYQGFFYEDEEDDF